MVQIEESWLNCICRNRYWNVDVFGILRGKYLSPAFAVKVGETAIRNCFKDQLSGIRKEGMEYMGNHPCIFTEIGIPYDMDDKYAYKTGDYSSQSSAMDANHFALEGCGCNGYALWLYMATVCCLISHNNSLTIADETRTITNGVIFGMAKTFLFSRSMTNLYLSILNQIRRYQVRPPTPLLSL